MGIEGPCGPCTEIHFSHIDDTKAAKSLVNYNTDQSVVELWNLVFMEHNKKLDGSLEPLSNHHVDTGMGLERLTAVLNGSRSNYDSDIFMPLFKSIEIQTNAQPYGGSFKRYVHM